MNNLTLTSQHNTNATLISNNFIDRYMPDANGEFVKIYIYLVRCMLDNSKSVSVCGLADIFSQTEADIMRALKYWAKVGAISLNFNGPGCELSGITFCNPSPAAGTSLNSSVTSANSNNTGYGNIHEYSNAASGNPAQDMPAGDYTGSFANNHIPINMETKVKKSRDSYTPTKMAELKSQEDFSMLLYAAGAYLGGTLSSSDASTIAYLYDELKFPLDLIEYLIEYCVSKGHKSMRYIEKVALSWADSGIHSIEQAKLELSNHNETTFSIMNAFGITNRNPGQREKDYISKWTEDYCFNNDIIIEACNRTLKATHQPSFEYADSILKKWRSENVRTTADILKADAAYELTQINKKNSSFGNMHSNSNKFNNFNQRNTDIDSLESSLISNNG